MARRALLSFSTLTWHCVISDTCMQVRGWQVPVGLSSTEWTHTIMIQIQRLRSTLQQTRALPKASGSITNGLSYRVSSSVLLWNTHVRDTRTGQRQMGREHGWMLPWWVIPCRLWWAEIWKNSGILLPLSALLPQHNRILKYFHYREKFFLSFLSPNVENFPDTCLYTLWVHTPDLLFSW